MKDLGNYDLFDVITNERLYKKLLDRLPNVVQQLMEAVIYLHRHNVVHRDIKPENIMVVYDDPEAKEDFKLVLIDLADAVYHTAGEDAEWRWSRRGTPDYLDPNIIRKFNDLLTWKELKAADMWNLGLVFYIILFRLPPVSVCQQLTRKRTTWSEFVENWDNLGIDLFDMDVLRHYNPVGYAFMKTNPTAPMFFETMKKLMEFDPNSRMRWAGTTLGLLYTTRTRNNVRAGSESAAATPTPRSKPKTTPRRVKSF